VVQRKKLVPGDTGPNPIIQLRHGSLYKSEDKISELESGRRMLSCSVSVRIWEDMMLNVDCLAFSTVDLIPGGGYLERTL
jgi:hypothetical protein